jgi:hypothetical protein
VILGSRLAFGCFQVHHAAERSIESDGHAVAAIQHGQNWGDVQHDDQRCGERGDSGGSDTREGFVLIRNVTWQSSRRRK